MKKIIALTLFLGMFSACVLLPLESRPNNAPETQSSQAISQTLTPSSIPENTFTPGPIVSATATRFTGHISIEPAQIVYYDITGSTAMELRESMNKLRPKDPYDGDKPVDSYADWYVSWNWPGYGTDNCDVSAVVVTYSINVILPRWEAPADASAELIAKWEKYIQSLTFHEKGHVDNFVNNYLGVKTAIQGATCSTAEAEAQKALESLRKFDSSYDSETKHGKTQGAVFP